MLSFQFKLTSLACTFFPYMTTRCYPKEKFLWNFILCACIVEHKLWKDKEKVPTSCMVRKQCKLKRFIHNLFQFIVQVSLSQFPRTPTTGALIIFVIFVIVFVLGITVSWLELSLLRSHFKCLSSSQEQSSSSLDNNLIVLPLELSNRNENGYNTLSGTWKSSTFWCRDFTFSKTVLVRFVKKALIWSNEWRV